MCRFSKISVLQLSLARKWRLLVPAVRVKQPCFQLLLRFYPLQTGQIALNGVDASQVGLAELRSF